MLKDFEIINFEKAFSVKKYLRELNLKDRNVSIQVRYNDITNESVQKASICKYAIHQIEEKKQRSALPFNDHK